VHDPIGVAVGQRPQQQRVDHGEDGAVGADADGEHRHRGDGEAARPPQQADAMAQVTGEIVDDGHARLGSNCIATRARRKP